MFALARGLFTRLSRSIVVRSSGSTALSIDLHCHHAIFYWVNFPLSSISALRFLVFLPLITILDTLYSFLLTSLQIRFYSTKNFRMLFGKLFLIFGGVLAPLSDIPEPWSKLFLNTPFSDLVFQPCYFSIKAEFYQITFLQWFARIILQLACLLALSAWMYRSSRNQLPQFWRLR